MMESHEQIPLLKALGFLAAVGTHLLVGRLFQTPLELVARHGFSMALLQQAKKAAERPFQKYEIGTILAIGIATRQLPQTTYPILLQI